MEKTEIFQAVNQKLTEKIQNLERLITETRASNNETKSSMGDKYETSREMVQQQINNLQIQLSENIKSRNFISQIQNKPLSTVGLGSLVETENSMFFIAVSLREITVKEKKVFVISTGSPLGKALAGCKKDDTFVLNGTCHRIRNVW